MQSFPTLIYQARTELDLKSDIRSVPWWLGSRIDYLWKCGRWLWFCEDLWWFTKQYESRRQHYI